MSKRSELVDEKIMVPSRRWDFTSFAHYEVFMEINGIFTPLVIIAKTIFIPLLLGAVLFYVTEPLQRFLEKRKMPRWGVY